MRPQDFSALSVLSENLGVVYEPKDDLVVVIYQGEQLFTIAQASKKGCPVYNDWVMESWVFEQYFELIQTFIKEVG